MGSIVIVDYGAGNLRSVQRAFEHLGHQAVISDRPEDVRSAAALVFPGQGASAPAMARLDEGGLSEAIRSAIAADTPFFGVCLGLQLLMEHSEEGNTPCLGVFRGSTRRLPPDRKVPHMGWNRVQLCRSHPVFAGVPEGSYFYFVHSYYAVPIDEASVLATTSYGLDFCSVTAVGNLVATQFHPEKSGAVGLRLYDNFVRSVVRREASSR